MAFNFNMYLTLKHTLNGVKTFHPHQLFYKILKLFTKPHFSERLFNQKFEPSEEVI